MSFKKESHPDEDQLILSIVDGAKLPDSIREHLSLCPRCLAGIKKIEQDLNNLGETARQLAPATHRKISLPVEKPSRIYRWLHDWWISSGAVAAAAIIILIIWSSVPKTNMIEDTFNIMSELSWEDDDFMTEISALTESVLPQVYLDITEEFDLCLDDEFIKFVVPSFEADSLSYEQERKGVKLC